MFSSDEEDPYIVESYLSNVGRRDLTVSFVAFFDSSVYVSAAA
jgi:hypothetical protein